MPGEDRRTRLAQALSSGWLAFTTLEEMSMTDRLDEAKATVRRVRSAAGGDFPILWVQLNVGDPPDWLTQDDWPPVPPSPDG